MIIDTQKLYIVCSDLMKEAGKIILSAHDTDNCLHSKPGTQNFVTDYDVAVQSFLMKGLLEAFPEACFIAEEKDNDSNVLNSELCFIIDPIDGTNCFIHNCRSSAISIGAVSHGDVVFGAVYNPYSDELVSARKGCGATINAKPAHVSERPPELGLGLFGTCPYYKDVLSEASFNMARDLFCSCVDIHRAGSAAIDLCQIATGSCEMFFEMVLQPWDIAAAKLIIEEAGGIITAFDGSPIELGKPSSVIAANRLSYPVLKQLASKYIPSLLPDT